MTEEKSDPKPVLKRRKNLFLLLGLGLLLGGMLLYSIFSADSDVATTAGPTMDTTSTQTVTTDEAIVDGIHTPTGLIVAEGFQLVRTQCTPCHSGKLIAQNRATRTGWKEMITWMQETQGLWPLGENEPIILDYLATHYGPEETGRRANLKDVEWYVLELE